MTKENWIELNNEEDIKNFLNFSSNFHDASIMDGCISRQNNNIKIEFNNTNLGIIFVVKFIDVSQEENIDRVKIIFNSELKKYNLGFSFVINEYLDYEGFDAPAFIKCNKIQWSALQ